jgi:transposase
MHPRDRQRTRRVHSAEFKAKVLAECQVPGVSMASVAQANGLNANLIRRWMRGDGLGRCGLAGPGDPAAQGRGPAERAPVLQFVPVDLAAAGRGAEPGLRCGTAASTEAAHMQMELCRGGVSLSMRWPASQAGQCVAWLRELAALVLK